MYDYSQVLFSCLDFFFQSFVVTIVNDFISHLPGWASLIQNPLSGSGVVAHAFSPVLRRQRQPDLFEIKASLVYRVSSRPARAIWWDPVSKYKTKQQQKIIIKSSIWNVPESNFFNWQHDTIGKSHSLCWPVTDKF